MAAPVCVLGCCLAQQPDGILPCVARLSPPTASAAVLSAVGMAVAQHQGHHGHKDHGAAAVDTRVLVRHAAGAGGSHASPTCGTICLRFRKSTKPSRQGKNGKAAATAEQRPRNDVTSAARCPRGRQIHAGRNAASRIGDASRRQPVCRSKAQNSDVTGDLKPALAVLSEVMNACVACHAGYRFK